MAPLSRIGASRAGQSLASLDARLRLIALLFYAVGIFVVLAVANTPLSSDEDYAELNRAGLNAVAIVAGLFALGSLAIPWERIGRNAFAVMPTAGSVFLGLCVYYSGGWDSFAYLLFVLVSVFYGLYFSARVAALGMVGAVLAGASPQLYEPNVSELMELLVAPVPLYLVLAFVSNYVVRQIALRERQIERLRQQTEMDGLTGVHNRRYFDAKLTEELERARRSREGFSLIFVDLDDFKQINDRDGHQVGDEVLCQVTRAVLRTLRSEENAFRVGGDELAILLAANSVGGARVAERVRDELRIQRRGHRLPTASAGIASFPGDAHSGEELLAKADIALYAAKGKGKDHAVVYTAALDGRSQAAGSSR